MKRKPPLWTSTISGWFVYLTDPELCCQKSSWVSLGGLVLNDKDWFTILVRTRKNKEPNVPPKPWLPEPHNGASPGEQPIGKHLVTEHLYPQTSVELSLNKFIGFVCGPTTWRRGHKSMVPPVAAKSGGLGTLTPKHAVRFCWDPLAE